MTDFHNPPVEIKNIIATVRAIFDQQVADVDEELANPHFTDDDARIWMHADALMEPKQAPECKRDLTWTLAILAAMAMLELGRVKRELW